MEELSRRARKLLQLNPNASHVVQLTDAELRRGWRVREVLKASKASRYTLLGPGAAVVER